MLRAQQFVALVWLGEKELDCFDDWLLLNDFEGDLIFGPKDKRWNQLKVFKLLSLFCIHDKQVIKLNMNVFVTFVTVKGVVVCFCIYSVTSFDIVLVQQKHIWLIAMHVVKTILCEVIFNGLQNSIL